VNVLASPEAMTAGRPCRVKPLAAAGVTTIPDCVPVALATAVSVAVRLWVPAVFSVALNVCVPASAAVKG
jgi:hypothetical protein